MPHVQTWVKVNAPVDEGIAELIEALSAFPKLETFASCQRDAAEPSLPSAKEGQPARIFFRYGQHDHAHAYQELAEFVLGYLGPGLLGEMGDRVAVKIHVVTEYIIEGELVVRQGVIPRTVKTLRRLRRNFKV